MRRRDLAGETTSPVPTRLLLVDYVSADDSVNFDNSDDFADWAKYSDGGTKVAAGYGCVSALPLIGIQSESYEVPQPILDDRFAGRSFDEGGRGLDLREAPVNGCGGGIF
jgi:hypothetical protein